MCKAKEKARKYLNKHYVDNTFSLNEEVKINPKIIEKAIDIAIREAKKEMIEDILEKVGFIPLNEANSIHYGHQNDTIEMAYLRGRNEIINELIFMLGKMI